RRPAAAAKAGRSHNRLPAESSPQPPIASPPAECRPRRPAAVPAAAEAATPPVPGAHDATLLFRRGIAGRRPDAGPVRLAYRPAFRRRDTRPVLRLSDAGSWEPLDSLFTKLHAPAGEAGRILPA